MDEIERLEKKRIETERKGNSVTPGMATNFPRNPPLSGMAYSKNFARFQNQGRFAVQTKD